ncbi:MAG: nickel pincer cofactor biosynthesis protein LarC [Campylobacteraceae bacterium]|nr:nickel pincer cofactor biosynthesis protein LarC [Campylobacteraceae bacterium]
MSKVLYYDCTSGISGDMNIAALLDLGVDFKHLQNELKKLNLNHKISHKKVLKSGILGIKFDVSYDDHTHARTFKEIKRIINSSNLSKFVKTLSIEIFTTIAKAEAKVHDISVENVHFHEIGAVDSIVDIVGAAVCLEYLGIEEIYSSKVELGGGVVKCDHGELSVPAPATCEILKDIPVSLGKANFELTTPTGAGIIKTIAKSFDEKLSFKIHKIGYGAGTKDASFPNLLRVMICEKLQNSSEETQTIIETNIDDMNAEEFSFLCELLFENGALDVYSSAIFMKKGRIGYKLSVLCKNEDSLNLENLIFENSSTIGLRKYEITKVELPRKSETIQTKYGEISVKISKTPLGNLKVKPEFDECKILAKKHGKTIKEIKEETLNEYGKTRADKSSNFKA